MKLRSRLGATVAGVSLATLGGSFWAVYLANNRVQERQLDAALIRVARAEAREAGQGGGGELMISEGPGPQANDTGPLTKYAAIYAPNGRVIDATPSFAGAPPPFAELSGRKLGQPFDLWQGGEHLRGVLIPIPAALRSRLLLAAPRTDLDGDEEFLGRAMLTVFGFAFAWVLLVSTWVVRRFTRDHETIAAVARGVARGDLSARVPLAGRDDEVKQLARDVNQMIERLSALLSAHKSFVAHAAHELRSPLTALYGELSHALRRARSADAYQSAIEEALDATKRLMTLAEDLLTLARLSGDDEQPAARVDLNQTLRRAQRLLEGEAQARQVAIEISGRAGAVAGDALDLERLLRNLLENAVRHCPAGQAVRVQLESGAEQVVRVANQGSIAQEERERIFEPFARGAYASVEGRPGVGLGLAIARQIAGRHRGALELSPQGQDAWVEFVLRLPSFERSAR